MKLPAKVWALCCGLALFAACTKSEEKEPTNNNGTNNTPTLSAKAKLLVDGKWQLTAFIDSMYYMGEDTTIDLYPTMNACEKDNFVTFLSDGTANEDEGANKCGNSQIETITWALLQNDTRLALVDNNPDTFDVVEISNAHLRFSATRKNSSGYNIYSVWTFKNIK